MIFFRKPLSTFRDHAASLLWRLRNSASFRADFPASDRGIAAASIMLDRE
jgi:hypothetical protein